MVEDEFLVLEFVKGVLLTVELLLEMLELDIVPLELYVLRLTVVDDEVPTLLLLYVVYFEEVLPLETELLRPLMLLFRL